ncbi:MAG: hypothetical protein EA362_07385 [Saprospirales bacterium]|nr:MAG: hypothetical protein EA362_07385 [Saprospirales bacterium]
MSNHPKSSTSQKNVDKSKERGTPNYSNQKNNPNEIIGDKKSRGASDQDKTRKDQDLKKPATKSSERHDL